MSIHLGDALSEGLERTSAQNGIQIAALYALTSLLIAIFSADMSAASGSMQTETSSPLLQSTQLQQEPILGLPVGIAVAGLLVVYFSQLLLYVVAVRTFFSEKQETIPREFLTHNLPMLLANLVVGFGVYILLVGIGLIMLLVPGIYIALVLSFWYFECILADRNFVEAFRESRELTNGIKVELFLLGIVLVGLALVTNLVSVAVGLVLPQLATMTISSVLGGGVSAFSVAVYTSAYQQATAQGMGDADSDSFDPGRNGESDPEFDDLFE
jgi:hypothetical protein